MKTRIGFFLTLTALVLPLPIAAAPQTETFARPDDAALALFEAASREDRPALEKLFGPSFLAAIGTGDPVADRGRLRSLAERMREGWQIASLDNRYQVIEVGSSRWPFPAPLTERDGRWSFNSTIGAQEIANRRIGENELRAIQVAQFYSDAQRLYRSRDRDGDGTLEYTDRFHSTPGKQDGLYWDGTRSVDASPLSPLINRAIGEGYNPGGKSGTVYQGYRYRILTAQGADAPGGAKSYRSKSGELTEGYALVAYPARWGVSGVMTFIVGPEGTVYESDLGPTTQKKAESIKAFNPGEGWQPVPE